MPEINPGSLFYDGDEPRRPRRGAPAAVLGTKSGNLIAPPCLGEALRRGRIVIDDFQGSDLYLALHIYAPPRSGG
jgi:hypothetical protein